MKFVIGDKERETTVCARTDCPRRAGKRVTKLSAIVNNAWWCGSSSEETCSCGSLFCGSTCLQLHSRGACEVDPAKRLPVDALREAAAARQVRKGQRSMERSCQPQRSRCPAATAARLPTPADPTHASALHLTDQAPAHRADP